MVDFSSQMNENKYTKYPQMLRFIPLGATTFIEDISIVKLCRKLAPKTSIVGLKILYTKSSINRAFLHNPPLIYSQLF